MTSDPTPDIDAFFDRFQLASDTLDTSTLRDLFCDVFLNLDPSHAAPVPRDVMINALPMREKLFGSIGAIGAELTDVTTTQLDKHHVLARTTWQTRFSDTAPAPEPLVLRSTFLLRSDDEGWRIAVYLNHQDIVSIITERAAAARA